LNTQLCLTLKVGRLKPGSIYGFVVPPRAHPTAHGRGEAISEISARLRMKPMWQLGATIFDVRNENEL